MRAKRRSRPPKPPAVVALTEREQNALAFAVRKLEQYRQADSPWGVDSVLTRDGSHSMVRDILQLGIADVRARLRLLRAARAGDRDCLAVINDLMLELQSRKIDLPCELQAWDMELREFGLPAQWSGPKKADRILLDLCIMLITCAVVVQFGLPRYKNEATTGKAASEIMAMALEQVGILFVAARKRTAHYKAVEAILTRYKGAWPTVPGWSAGM